MLSSLGNVVYLQERYEQAVGYHQEAIAIAQRLKDIPAEIKALYNVGVNLLALERKAKTIEIWRQGLRLAKQQNLSALEEVLSSSILEVGSEQDLGQS